LFKYPYIINPIKAIIKQPTSLDIPTFLSVIGFVIIIVPRGEFLGERLKFRMVKDPLPVAFLIFMAIP
jgi:hypothetical protein